jgi:hypothetical protein
MHALIQQLDAISTLLHQILRHKYQHVAGFLEMKIKVDAYKMCILHDQKF